MDGVAGHELSHVAEQAGQPQDLIDVQRARHPA